MSTPEPLQRYLCQWGFKPSNNDELELQEGDVVLVAEKFEDGWMRGLKLKDLQVGFFPAAFVREDQSTIYTLRNNVLVTAADLSSHNPNKRSRIALELCDSEKTYLKKLKLLNEKYLVGLQMHLKTMISTDDYNVLFGNVQPLLTLSQNMVVNLVSRMEAWDNRSTKVGDLFLSMEEHMKWFDPYSVQNVIGSQVLGKLRSQEKFLTWLLKAEEETGFTLDSLLIEPIQRVTRYEMLLKDLLKYTPDEHPDHANLQSAVGLILKINGGCNENIGKITNELKLLAISEKFLNNEVSLTQFKKFVNTKGAGKKPLKRSDTRLSMDVNRKIIEEEIKSSFKSFFDSEHSRTYIMEGSVMKARHNFQEASPRNLFLTSDVLLVGQPTSKSCKMFKLKEQVGLIHAWITDTFFEDQPLPPNGFVLGTPYHTHRFLAQSEEDKKSWFSTLHKTIFAQKQLFDKLVTHLSIPDELFVCFPVKARQHYIGMNTNELTFRAGDTVNVVGFKKPDGNWRPGLYSDEMFDPSSEWYFGYVKETFGWFPQAYVTGSAEKALEPLNEEPMQFPMSHVLAVKRRFVELTGRCVPPLTEDERIAKISVGEEHKTMKIPTNASLHDIVQSYYKELTDINIHWSLVEESIDGTVSRQLEAHEVPSRVVDLWGKFRDKMKFRLIQQGVAQ